jgi:penicillin-binding protein 2
MTALVAVVAFAFAALVTRMWFLQVLATEEYQQNAESNRVRLVPVAGPRGKILDRNGDALVTNEPTRVVTIDRRKVADEDEDPLLARLSEVLGVSEAELADRLHSEKYLPYQPIPVHQGATKEEIFYIEEHAGEFPGVDYQIVGVRRYVYRDLAPHLLGNLGEINKAELNDPSFAGYLPGQLVGRGGVEQYYERYLRGDDGWLKLEVDSSGKVLDELGREPPVPGNDLVLSLDAEIQKLAQETLTDATKAARNIFDDSIGRYLQATAGAVVVLDPRNGQVLAMVSQPSYDPRLFQDGLTEREWEKLNSDRLNYPLNNRAISGLYPPASTFKPFVAAAALRAGHARMSGTYDCPSDYVVPGDTSGTVFHNWNPSDQGSISLTESLVQSCDTVYYDFGFRFWLERGKAEERGFFQEHLRQWGFGRTTGIDISGNEAPGRIPDAEWKREIHRAFETLFPYPDWLPGDDINLSIGQGDVLVTPLQMATAYAAIANGGTLYRPQVALRVDSPDGRVVKRLEPQVIGRVPMSPEQLRFLRQALTGVVSSPSGTATTAFSGFPTHQVPVAGKTGTAEVSVDGKDALHSWFAAMAPADDPRYLVVALVEEGGHGAQVAAPIVRRVLEGLMDLPESDFQLGTSTD